MMSLGKIFLSHSSLDKGYVDYIAKFFGKDRCVYDEMCFEKGMKTLNEIFNGLQRTDIFVWFISNNSLESEWVQREFAIADELHNKTGRLYQIFPIIIDESIKYDDSRIPQFITRGFNSYNLRYIADNRIACKKIQGQFIKRIFEVDESSKNNYSFFYGRDEQIRMFKKAYDSGKKIKCIVASGIEGIGRKSYVVKALHDTRIFPEYEIPFSVSLKQDDQIEDLIIKISDLGFGKYTLSQITSLSSLDAKIDVLASLFKEIQDQNEHVMIYDQLSIISYSREPKFWFTKALEKVRPEITVSLLSSVELSFTYLRMHEEYFGVAIKELSYPEWNGLLRIYSQWIGCPFGEEEREYFKDVLTGYPPQVLYCADLAKGEGVAYVKDHAQEIIKNVSYKVVNLLSVVFTDEDRKEGYELLALFSQYGIMPMKVVYDIVKISPVYKQILSKLKALTVCRQVGVCGEYLEISPSVADYVQRNSFKISQQIQQYLRNKFELFYKNIDTETDEDFETLKYYLRELVKAGKTIPPHYLYSTLYITSVRELYDGGKYNRVIEVVEILKENDSFSRFAESVQAQLQRYYCLALAREINSRFYTEVEWFKQQAQFDQIEYDFLRGFMFRQNGEFDKSIERCNKILSKKPNHRRALRELVSSYRGLEDYENFGEYARMNYKNDPDNPYNIQPYFEFLIHKKDKNKEDRDIIDKMLLALENRHKIIEISAYYELNAQYAMYVEKNFDRALQFLLEGSNKFTDSSYILRTYFDCYELKRDINGMKNVLERLNKCAGKNMPNHISYKRRKIIYDAYDGKTFAMLELQVRQLSILSETAQDKLLRHVKQIIEKRR